MFTIKNLRKDSNNSKSRFRDKENKIEDPLIYTQEYEEYSLLQNFIRSKYIGIGIIVILLTIFYDIFANHREYDQIYLISIIILFIISIINILLVSFLKNWCLHRPVLAKLIITIFWICFMIIDLPSFLRDAEQTFQPLNITTWLAGMCILLVLRRRQIFYIYSVFLIINLGIAFYVNAPLHYFGNIISRITLTALVAYFLLYPYNVAVVKTLIESYTDPLTRLMNRREGEKRISSLLETNKRYTALYMVDIDNFKCYNDTHGHIKGDEALLLVAQCVKKIFARSEDTSVRYGGEEILVCASVDSSQNAEVMAKKLHECIKETEKPIDKDNVCLPITVSIGFVVVEPDKKNKYDVKSLIHDADLALYKAKQSGKNCTVQFH